MKKITALLLLTVLSAVSVKAQLEKKQIKKVLELTMPGSTGSNGAAVAWHPVLKKYYASMAGNMSYPIAVYDIAGKRLSSEDQEALFDIRGLWYNSDTKTLQMNGYNDFGWAEYVLDKKGFPKDVTVLREGMNQPDAQSAGAFNAREEKVYFYNSEDGNIEIYDLSTSSYEESIELTLGRPAGKSGDNEDVLEDYNSSTVIYTGLPGAEIGLLNHEDNMIELYNIRNGYMTRKLVLPADAPAAQMLNFAFANGIYWLFNKSTRTWEGYK
jgi:WD40 repeat protein